MSRREFQFEEGTSRKFWAITVEGQSFTAQFGKIGTAGQTQTKSFGSDAEAQNAANKLIAEKTKKGYTEVGAAAASTPAPTTPKPAKTKAVESVAAPAAPAALAVTRRLDIPQPDWLRLPGQSWPLRPRPEAKPFDLAECLQRMKRLDPAGFWYSSWSKCHIAVTLTPAEARFWLEAMTQGRTAKKFDDFLRKLGKGNYDKSLSAKEIIAKVNDDKLPALPDYVLPLSNLMPFEDFFELIVGDRLAAGNNWRKPFAMMEGFREHVLPYLTEPEVVRLRNVLRSYLDPSKPADAMIPWVLAACLGMQIELLEQVKTYSDGQFAGHYWAGTWEFPQLQLFHLDDAYLIEQQFRRVRAPLITPQHVHAWLLLTELRALDFVRDSILGASKKDIAEKLTKTLATVQAPELAPIMQELKLNSKAAAVARQWLDDNPGNAIAGLIPVAAGTGKLADAAIDYLREAHKRGFTAYIEEQLKEAAPAVAEKARQDVLGHVEKVYEAIDDKSTPKWLRDVLAGVKAKASDWARPTNLPPLLVEGRRLRDEQVSAVLAALQGSALGSPQPLVKALHEHGDRAALAAFAWKLFELWLEGGAASKEKWAFNALGHFGDDAAAIKLTPLLRAWPGESQHQRAVVGLEVLRAIGSDTALTQLNGIAQKLKFKGLQNKARELMEAIAADRGLSREQLEDRIVPDLDLDARGGRAFDFGPRQFQLVLGSDLKPQIKDDTGKAKDDLPKPGAKDDPDKANAEIEEWKLLKKQLRDAVKVQVVRLEQAMVTGRRWSPTEFETLLVRHPLMVNLARRLLWGGYDKKGKLTRLFRVTEEQEYADMDDRACTLDGLAAVGIVHPLHLTEEQRTRWGQVFGDYAIITPFPQLGRSVFALEPAEAKGKTIQRLDKRQFPAASVRGTLENLGWNRGSASDHGVIQEFYKPFPGSGVTSLLEIEPGIAMGMMDMLGEQEVKRVFFLDRIYQAQDYPYHKETELMPLKQVDAIALSEVLNDLTTLASKGK